MRKRSNRKIRPAEIPCLVMSELVPEAQIVLLTAIKAFREGWAEPAHFDCMLDTRDMLLLGANAKRANDIAEAARAINVALSNIKDSWDGEKFNFSDDELNALQILVDISNDFWLRQSGSLYHAAYAALKKWRKQQHEDQCNETGTSESWMVRC
jgi:hypothetical protein